MAAGESVCKEPGPYLHPSSKRHSRARARHGRKTWTLGSLGMEARGCKPPSKVASLAGSHFFKGLRPQTFGKTFKKPLSHRKQPRLALGLVVRVKPTFHQLHPSALFLYTPHPSAGGAAAAQSILLALTLIASEVFEQDFKSFLPRCLSRTNKVFVGGGVKNSSK